MIPTTSHGHVHTSSDNAGWGAGDAPGYDDGVGDDLIFTLNGDGSGYGYGDGMGLGYEGLIFSIENSIQ